VNGHNIIAINTDYHT